MKKIRSNHSVIDTANAIFGAIRRFGSTRGRAEVRGGEGLSLEVLESRRLLAGQLVTGAEADGDAYEISLSGPGALASTDIGLITLTGTTGASRLTVEVISVGSNGDGKVAVGMVEANGAALGRIEIQGDLGGINVGKVSQLEALSLGKGSGSHVFAFNDDVKQITVPEGISGATINITGDLDKMVVGDKKSIGSDMSDTELSVGGDAGTIQLLQSLTAGSKILVQGDVKTLSAAKSVVNTEISVGGDVSSLTVGGSIRQDSIVDVGGGITKMQVKKGVSDTDLTVDGVLKKVSIGGDLEDCTVLAGAIDEITVGDDLNDVQMNVSADIQKFQAGDVNGLTLRLGGSLWNMNVKLDLDSSLFSVLNDIGKIKIGQDLYRTTIMGGIDIGADLTAGTGDDLEWGDLEIASIRVGGDMVDSSIAAGVKTNAANDGQYGDGDDERAYNDGTGTAHIGKVDVKGDIASSGLPGETFAIAADDGIDSIRSGGKEFTGAPGVAVEEF